MILTINIENMHVVVGGIEEGNVLFVESISTDFGRTETEYAMQIKNIFELHNIRIESVNGAILSSVVPPITKRMQQAVYKVIQKEALVIGPGVKTGLNILTDHPEQVGSDLVAMSVAANTWYQAPLIVVNLGTAVTFSVINERKQYIGGTILPGLLMSASSLANDTAQLPKIGLDTPKRVIGKNTIDCMRSGLIYGTAASVDGMIDRIEEELGYTVETIIATGEQMKYILPHCRRRMHLHDTLLLEGLYEIYQKNQKY